MIPALVLPDGRRIELDEDVVLGRAPVAPESSPGARSISLSVPTVSKTHALIGQDESGVWLVDLNSSNGSEVLDDTGMSERAVPGRRLAVPAGFHIRVGTDTIITIDSGAASLDDLDRTTVVRPARVTPTVPTAADVSDVVDPTDAVERPSVGGVDPPAPLTPEPAVSATSASPPLAPIQPSPSVRPPPSPQPQPQPQPQPPQPQPPHPQPPPPNPQPSGQAPPPTEVYAVVPGPSFASGAAPQQAVPADHFSPSSTGSLPTKGTRAVAHRIGALLVLVWSAVGFASLRGWIPDFVADAVDGRLLDFFVVPSRFLIEFFEFYSLITLPDSLSALSRGADIGPVIAIVVSIVAFVLPNRVVRWTLAVLVVIPLLLLFGLVVTLLFDQFDAFTDDIDRFIPWFVLPGLGCVLLLWPSGRSASAPAASQDVFYAPGQSPEPPFSGPGAPPFS